MATVIVNDGIKGRKTWKAGFDSVETRHSNNGERFLAIGGNAGDPNGVYILLGDNADSLIQKIADPELRAMMQESGIMHVPEVVLIN